MIAVIIYFYLLGFVPFVLIGMIRGLGFSNAVTFATYWPFLLGYYFGKNQ